MTNDAVKVRKTVFLTGGAFRAALLHFLLSLFLQGQNLLWTHLAAALPTSAADLLGRQLGGLLLFQWSSVLAALLVGALVAVLLRFGAIRSSLLVSVLAGVLLVADAWAYRVLGDHLNTAFLPFVETPSFLVSSLLAEIDFPVLVDLMLLATGVVWQSRAKTGSALSDKRLIALVSVLAAYLTLNGAALVYATPAELSWHPIAGLVRNSLTVRTQQHAVYDLEAVVRPAFESLPIDPADTARLAAAAGAVHRIARPNIVLVVLEGTGTRQLLRDGEIDAKVTPNLARLARHGVLFDQVYANIPGTAHANLAMSTGGRYPTWQRINDLLRYPYTGDVLARRLKLDGYRTGLFASADLGYLEARRFFAQADYDLLSDFGLLPPDRQETLRLNSWGGRDDAMAESAAAWLDKAGGSEQPFFLHFMTNSPHHPYEIPADFPRLMPGEDAPSRYANALHFADTALGTLIRKVESSGKAERTVFVITGDHGDAFNRTSWRIHGHRQGLYEEGIRTFLLVSSPSIASPVRSSRIGNHGDLLPTLLSLTGGRPPEVPGQNLFGERFLPRTAFFQFGVASGSWGLRDGRWKYISPSAVAPPELYDLAADPDEQVNLAAKEPARVLQYEQLCSTWYFGRNAEFRDFLAGYPATPFVADKDAKRLGLEALTSGVLVPSDNRTFFEAARIGNPIDRVAFETRWRPASTERRVVYRWQSAIGNQITSTQVLRPMSTTQRVFLPGAAPRVVGIWNLTVEVNGEKVGATQFRVSPAVQARVAADYRWPELVNLRIGRDSSGHTSAVREFSAGQPIKIDSEWDISDQDRALSYVLEYPSGKADFVPVSVMAGEVRHSLTLNPPLDVELGEWSLVVVYNDMEIGRQKFRMGAPASAP